MKNALATTNIPPTPIYQGWGDFTNDPSGVYVSKTSPDGQTLTLRITTVPVSILLKVRNIDTGTDWRLTVSFSDPTGSDVTVTLPMIDFGKSSAPWFETLLKGGLQIDPDTPGSKGFLRQYLVGAQNIPIGHWTSRSGWLQNKSGFIIGDQSYPPRSDLVFDAEIRNPYGTSGTIATWQKEVAEPARNNPIIMFGILAAFAGTLLALVDSDSTVFNLVSLTSTGKSTALKVASTVWGKPHTANFLGTWRVTDNALEYVCAARTDTFLAIDELGQADPRKLPAMVYMVAQGAGKGRAKGRGGLQSQQKWRFMALSSGEVSLASVASNTTTIHGGMGVRFMDIDAETIISDWHEKSGPREFAEDIEAASQCNYGHAGPVFVSQLVQHKNKAIKLISDCRNSFRNANFVPNDNPPEIGRGCNAYGTILAAGFLCIEWGVLPWTKSECREAVQAAFDGWIRQKGGKKSLDHMQIEETLRHFLTTHLHSGFSGWNIAKALHQEQIGPKLYGFVRRTRSGVETVLMPRETLERTVFPGRDLITTLRVLRDLNILIPNKDGKRLSKAAATPPDSEYSTGSFYEFALDFLNLSFVWNYMANEALESIFEPSDPIERELRRYHDFGESERQMQCQRLAKLRKKACAKNMEIWKNYHSTYGPKDERCKPDFTRLDILRSLNRAHRLEYIGTPEVKND